MKRHAKASSAGSTSAIGGSRGLFGRTLAARGAFPGGAGSGAPSGRLALVLAIAAALVLVFAPGAQAAKGVVSSFGSTSTTPALGGTFATAASGIGGTAVYNATGDIYVVDRGNNRIQQFSASGAFIRAWGQDVDTAAGTGFEICTVAANCKIGITTAQTGGALSAPQGIAVDQATGNVYVTNQGFKRVEEYSSTGTFIRAFGQAVVASGPDDANAKSAKQTVTIAGASGGTFTLSFRGKTTAAIAWNATAAELKAALEAITTIGPGSVTVTGGPGGTAPLAITFAGGLANTPVPAITANNAELTPGGSTATVATEAGQTGFEVCNTTDVCTTGTATGTGGSFGAAMGYPAVAPPGAPNAGNVSVADTTNLRVQEFTSSGAFVRAFGNDVVNVGADNGGSANEIQKITVAATSGNFTLTFGAGTTAALASNATAAQVEAALNALTTIGGVGGRVSVTGGPGDGTGTTPYLVTFGGSKAGTNVAAMTATNTSLTGGSPTSAVTVATATDGAPGPEVCLPANDTCKAGVSGAGTGQFGSASPTRVAVDSSGQTYAVDTGNNRVQKFNYAAASASNYVPATLTGTGATNRPTDVGVDPVSDSVYVVKPNGGTPNERQVFQFDGSANLLDTHAVGAGITTGNGLAVASSTAAAGAGNLYLTTTAGLGAAQQVFVLNNKVLPAATIDPGSGFTFGANTATFTGKVNPTGYTTGYHFEYSVDGVNWTKVPAADATLGFTDNVAHAVSQAVIGLNPQTLYHVRLVATKPFAAGSATSSETTFTTLATGPAVTVVNPDEISDTTATLTAKIDPSSEVTTWHFEYGVADCASNACTSVPVPSATLAAGAGNTFVSQGISGLQASTTYHFRVVAVNGTGETDSPDQAFTTAATPVSSLMPSGYELVSPAGSQDYDVGQLFGSGPGRLAADAKLATPDGRCITYSLDLNGTLPGMARDGGATDFVLACRTDSGWTSKAPAGDRTACSYNGSSQSAGQNSEVIHDVADDGSRAVITAGGCIQTRLPLSGGLDQNPVSLNPTGQSLFDDEMAGDVVSYLSGAYDAVGPIVRTDSLATKYLGGSRDLTVIYFATAAALLPGVPVSVEGAPYLYRRSGGVTTLVSKTSGGVPVTLPDGTSAPGSIENGMQGTVSEDGSAVTFTTRGGMDPADADGQADVYQVRDGQALWVSQTRFSGSTQAAASKFFEGASANGHQIYFATTEKLVGNGTTTGDLDNAQDIYVYNEDAPTGQELSRVSVSDPGCSACNDNESSTNPLTTSTAKFVAASKNGNVVFFISGDVLNGADTDGQQSLYAHNLATGTTSYIAPVGVGAVSDGTGVDAGTASAVEGGSLASFTRAIRPIRVSQDGMAAAFELTTDVSLPPGAGGPDTDGTRDLFVWRATDGVHRVRQGIGPDENTATVPLFGCQSLSAKCDPLTFDGRVAYFQTTDRLAPGDNDAGLADVYAVDTGSGRVAQISPSGSAPFEARYMYNSTTGSDVFFMTREAIDPSRDSDSEDVDVYDARTGVPVLAPAAGAPACNEDTCQSPPAQAPSVAPVGTSQFSGPVNPTPIHKKKVHKHRTRHEKSGKTHKRVTKKTGRSGR